jgi:hypothetical protein
MLARIALLIVLMPLSVFADEMLIQAPFDGKVKAFLTYDNVTRQLLTFRIENTAKPNTLPTVTVRTQANVVLYNGNIPKGMNTQNIPAGYFMIVDKETGRLQQPFRIEVNLPFGVDQ